MSGLLVNPVFISKFFKDYGGAAGTATSIDLSITGIAVSCLQLSTTLGALITGGLGDIIWRKKYVHVVGFIYFLSAFFQMFTTRFATFIAGRTI